MGLLRFRRAASRACHSSAALPQLGARSGVLLLQYSRL